MSVDIRLVDSKFFAQLNNGDDFTLNPADFTAHLKSNVMERVKTELTVEVDWYAELTTFDIIMDSVNTTVRITDQTANWLADGLRVGDQVKWSVDDGTNTSKYTGDVGSITGPEIVLNNLVLVSGFAIPDGPKSYVNNKAFIVGLTQLTALNYNPALIENNESFNVLNKLTNADLTFAFSGIDHGAPLTFTQGTPLGLVQSGYTGSAEVAFSTLVLDKDTINNELTTQQFIIKHEFRVIPLYRDGEIDSLRGIAAPPSDIFNGSLSLKYVCQTEWRTVVNDPNTAKLGSIETIDGSVGYLNESFNGFPNRFTNTVPVYFDVTNNIGISKLNANTVNKVTFSIESLDSIFTATTPVIMGHSAIIDSSVYSNGTDNYDTTWINETLRTATGDPSISGSVIKNFTSTFQSASQIDIEFEIQFNNTQLGQIINDQDYILYYNIQDPNEDINDGGKVVNRLDVNTYDKSEDIFGLFEADVFDHYPHPYEFNQGSSQGFSSGKMFVEDGQMANCEFRVLNEYEGQDVNIDALLFKIVAYNSVTNTWFDIRSLNIDLSSQVNVSGIQNFNLNTTRGYILKDTDIFNFYKLNTGTNDGTWQNYNAQIGYKIPWQDWINLVGADTVFYDPTKENNGLNNNSSNYSFSNDYKIRMLLQANLTVGEITTEYILRSGEFEAYNYDTDDLIPDGFTAQISTHDIFGNSLANNVIVNGFTEFRAIFIPSGTNPPVFTTNVDFTEVATIWNRYAHGNKLVAGLFLRLPNWVNDQADDVDTFEDGSNTFTKNDTTLYTSTPATIVANQNCGAVYGCYSPKEYEYYEITGDMYSDFADNDVIKYDIAFYVDDNGVEHALSLCATTGGVLLDLSTGYIPGDDTTDTIEFIQGGTGDARWALVYNMGKRTCVQLDEFATGEVGYLWNDPQVGDLNFVVNRNGNDITVTVDWPIDGTNYNNVFNYNLNSNAVTQQFIGPKSIGFAFLSQTQGGFRNVAIIDPEADYYTILRIEEENNPSDQDISELSSLIEAPTTSLLEQLTGTERKAILSWDGTKFVSQGRFDTTQINLGQRYKLSAELRRRALVDSFPAGQEFEFIIDTNLSGVATEFTPPINAITGSVYIEWGDNTNNTITSVLDPNLTHVYGAAGIYTVKIWGDYQWQFENTGDADKLTEVTQWGNHVLYREAFYGCGNFTTISATDAPTLDNDLTWAFRLCDLLAVDFSMWDFLPVTIADGLIENNQNLVTVDLSNTDFANCINLTNFLFNNVSLTTLNVTGANFDAVLYTQFAFNCSSLNTFDIGVFNFSNTLFMNGFGVGSGLNTTFCGQLYARIATFNGSLQPNVTLGMDGINYPVANQADRDLLTNAPNNWTITDAGPI